MVGGYVEGGREGGREGGMEGEKGKMVRWWTTQNHRTAKMGDRILHKTSACSGQYSMLHVLSVSASQPLHNWRFGSQKMETFYTPATVSGVTGLAVNF